MPNHEAFLVTGVAGSGKSTLGEVFNERGHTTYDIDKGFAQWVNRTTGQPAKYSVGEPMTTHHDWLVDREKIQRAIKRSVTPIWFFGSAHNLHECSDLFRKVFLLQYPSAEVLKDRILNRTENDYGKAPGELDAIMGYWHEYEDNFSSIGAIAIDCTRNKYDIYKELKKSVVN